MTSVTNASLVTVCILLMCTGSPLAQESGVDRTTEGEWQSAASTYMLAATCAKKRFSFSRGDAEKLKEIAVAKAQGINPDYVNTWWNDQITLFSIAPIDAEKCQTAFSMAKFLEWVLPGE